MLSRVSNMVPHTYEIEVQKHCINIIFLWFEMCTILFGNWIECLFCFYQLLIIYGIAMFCVFFSFVLYYSMFSKLTCVVIDAQTFLIQLFDIVIIGDKLNQIVVYANNNFVSPYLFRFICLLILVLMFNINTTFWFW